MHFCQHPLKFQPRFCGDPGKSKIGIPSPEEVCLLPVWLKNGKANPRAIISKTLWENTGGKIEIYLFLIITNHIFKYRQYGKYCFIFLWLITILHNFIKTVFHMLFIKYFPIKCIQTNKSFWNFFKWNSVILNIIFLNFFSIHNFAIDNKIKYIYIYTKLLYIVLNGALSLSLSLSLKNFKKFFFFFIKYI